MVGNFSSTEQMKNIRLSLKVIYSNKNKLHRM